MTELVARENVRLRSVLRRAGAFIAEGHKLPADERRQIKAEILSHIKIALKEDS